LITKPLINNLLEYSRLHPDGFTVRIHHGVIKDFPVTLLNRYVVAKKTIITIEKFKDDTTTDKEIIAGHSLIIYPFLYVNGKLIKEDFYMGGWYEKHTNTYYIEVVSLYNSLVDALLIGEYLRQISIYDLLDKEEIPVKETLKNLGIIPNRESSPKII